MKLEVKCDQSAEVSSLKAIRLLANSISNRSNRLRRYKIKHVLHFLVNNCLQYCMTEFLFFEILLDTSKWMKAVMTNLTTGQRPADVDSTNNTLQYCLPNIWWAKIIIDFRRSTVSNGIEQSSWESVIYFQWVIILSESRNVLTVNHLCNVLAHGMRYLPKQSATAPHAMSCSTQNYLDSTFFNDVNKD